MSLLCASANGLGCITLGSSVDDSREEEDALRPKIGCSGGAAGSDDNDSSARDGSSSKGAGSVPASSGRSPLSCWHCCGCESVPSQWQRLCPWMEGALRAVAGPWTRCDGGRAGHM
jgi:hypothetical protein